MIVTTTTATGSMPYCNKRRGLFIELSQHFEEQSDDKVQKLEEIINTDVVKLKLFWACKVEISLKF